MTQNGLKNFSINYSAQIKRKYYENLRHLPIKLKKFFLMKKNYFMQ